MKNDRSIKFTPIKITVAVIISLILHLVFFTNFNFKQLFISKNNNQSDELEIFVTQKIEKPINETKVQKQIKTDDSEKKLSNKMPEKKEKELKQVIENDLSTNSKRIQNEEVVEDTKKPIDKKKILSTLSQLDFNVKPQTQNENLRIKNISAKSPEYIYRLYFEAWKKKVERM